MKKVVKIAITLLIIIILLVGFYYISKTVSSVTGKTIVGWAGKIFK